ncbi:hypothetical protein D3C86_1096670 [compost metagenome]
MRILTRFGDQLNTFFSQFNLIVFLINVEEQFRIYLRHILRLISHIMILCFQ